MKHLIQQIILLIFYLVFIDFAQASYCYSDTNFSHYNLLVEEDGIYLQKTDKDRNKISYVSQSKVRLKDITDKSVCHTDSPYYDLLVEKDGIYLQETVKAKNKISYISQSKVRLTDITDKSARIISDDGNKILVLFNAKYYFIPKPLYRRDISKYEITPLFNENEVSKIVSNKFFLISNHWYYVSYTFKGESDKHKIPELKGNLEIIAYHNGSLAIFYHMHFSEDIEDRFLLKSVDKVLLKDDNAVYIYDISKNKLKKIPHLTPSQTHFVESNYISYLYDDDTFYLIDKDYKYTDITEEFNLQGKYNGFTKAEMHTNWSVDSMDTKDGLIWINIKAYFTPIKATYLNAYKDLYVYHDKVFDDNLWALQDEANPSDPSYRDRSIDISNVQNPGELHQISSSGFFLSPSDFVKNPRELHRPLFSVFFDNQQQYSLKEDPLRLEKIAPHDYSRLTTTDYIKIKEKQIFINERQLDTDKFQDIPIFLGSIVDIIHDCDTNGPLAEIDYFYFFTDGKKVYAYINPEKNQKPKVLDNVSPQNLKINDYDTLKKLLNISDGVNLH